MARGRKPTQLDALTQYINQLSSSGYAISNEDVRNLISYVTEFTRISLVNAGYAEPSVKKLITKFRDAGRRSAPWKATSNRVPGRPQDGADGNRQLRWLFEEEHKYYANEVNATLVEVKYFLQTLSMAGAPVVAENILQTSFIWLLGHELVPGSYLDPIQLIPIDFNQFISDPKLVQSGHLTPLDRGGRHVPSNTFLMLARSNQLQGNQTLEELVDLMAQIVVRHQERRNFSSS